MRHVGQTSLLAALGFASLVGCAVQENAERPNNFDSTAGAPTAGSNSDLANVGGHAVGGNSGTAGSRPSDSAGANDGASGGEDAGGGPATGGAGSGGSSGGAGGNSGGTGSSGGTGNCVKTDVTLSAVADADIRADSSTANDGGTGDLQVRRFGTAASWRALVAFDPSAIPAGSSITSAELSLTVAASSGAAKSIGAHRVEPPHWDELHVTWQSASLSDAWSKPGGDFAATATAVAQVSGDVLSGAAIHWDVTADVATFVARPSENLGWLLKDEAEPSAGSGELVAFAARSHGNPSWQPHLQVVYCH